MLKKGFKFVLYKKNSIILFNLYFIMLLAKIDLVSEKRGYKRDTFVARDSSCIKIVLILLIEVIVLYVYVSIVKIRFLGLKKIITECNTCLKLFIFLALNK